MGFEILFQEPKAQQAILTLRKNLLAWSRGRPGSQLPGGAFVDLRNWNPN